MLKKMKKHQKRQASRWFLFIGLGILYLQGLWTGIISPEQTGKVSLFLLTLLMLPHFGLYWINFAQTTLSRWRLWPFFYFTVQGAIVLMVSLIVARDWPIVVGFYFALIAQAFVFFRKKRFVLLVILGYLIMFVLSVGMQAEWDWTSFRVPIVFTIPMILFAVGYSQLHAREHLQSVLLELEDAHAQVIDYAERVEELTLVAERQRLARDLHDTLAQGLTGVVLQLEVVDSQLAHHAPQRARELVQEIMVSARSTLAEARRAIHDLRTYTTCPQDISSCVLEEIQRFIQATGISCTIDLALLEKTPEPFCEHVFRMITEALANVVRHAHADQVWITTMQSDIWLTCEVRDNGIGFSSEKLEQPTDHYGLLGLRERARLAKGLLEIKSAPGEGTTLRFSVPLNREKGREQ